MLTFEENIVRGCRQPTYTMKSNGLEGTYTCFVNNGSEIVKFETGGIVEVLEDEIVVTEMMRTKGQADTFVQFTYKRCGQKETSCEELARAAQQDNATGAPSVCVGEVDDPAR